MNATDSFFQQQHVVVTGGGSGIGAAIAAQFARKGATLTLMGRDADRLSETAHSLGAGTGRLDVTDRASVAAAFAAAEKERGPVTMLINNAGAAESGAFVKMDDALWDRMLAVNLSGTYACTRAVAPAMLSAGFGRVVNIASTAALKGYAYVSAYCAAKHGVVGLTRSLALEFARKGVTVNAVCPGYTDTGLVARSIDNIVTSTGRRPDEALAELVKVNPQQRLVQPEEVADTVLWLCGANAASITGQSIAVAGGEVM